MDSRGYDTGGIVIEEDMAKRSLDRLVAINEISLKVGQFLPYGVSLTRSFKYMTGRGPSYVDQGKYASLPKGLHPNLFWLEYGSGEAREWLSRQSH